MELALATDVLIDELAARTCVAPVEPPSLGDHDWLVGDPVDVAARLRAHRDRGREAWVVVIDGHPAGMVSARQVGSSVDTWSFVCAADQGRGVGTAARAGVLAIFQARGVRMAVSASRAGGPSAAVSRRLGYRLVGIEARRRPDGLLVDLERYEVDLAAWTPPAWVSPVTLPLTPEGGPLTCQRPGGGPRWWPGEVPTASGLIS